MSNTWHMWTSKMPISVSLTNSSVLPALRISKQHLPVCWASLQLIFCSRSVHKCFNIPAWPAQDSFSNFWSTALSSGDQKMSIRPFRCFLLGGKVQQICSPAFPSPAIFVPGPGNICKKLLQKLFLWEHKLKNLDPRDLPHWYSQWEFTIREVGGLYNWVNYL